MLDDVQEPPPPPDKTTLTPKEQPKPLPVVTVLSDGTIRVDNAEVGLGQVYSLLLNAAAGITGHAINRAMTLERMLATIRTRFDGFDDETLAAINRALAP